MFRLNDVIINANVGDVLNILRADLGLRGIDRFRIIKENGNNVQCTCPFHKGGIERKPSFGINVDNGLCNCFTCHWSGTIDNMISELYGRNDFGEYGMNWLIKNFNTTSIETRPNLLSMLLKKRNVELPLEREEVSQSELAKYRWYHPYMFKRGLTKDVIQFFDVGYDKSRDCITFPVKDLNSKVVFVATRSINGKFFTLPSSQNKPVYGADKFVGGKYPTAWITESFFNCLTLWKLGIPSMALMGTGTKEQYEILKSLPVRRYVVALDPDDAGLKGTERFRKNVPNKIIQQVLYDDKTKDINDLQEEVLKLRVVF